MIEEEDETTPVSNTPNSKPKEHDSPKWPTPTKPTPAEERFSFFPSEKVNTGLQQEHKSDCKATNPWKDLELSDEDLKPVQHLNLNQTKQSKSELKKPKLDFDENFIAGVEKL